MNQLAPIGISTYVRLEHVKKTIAALQKNTLAKESELYLFSDAPGPGDEGKVLELRKFLYTIGGFKKIHIVERKKNNRVYNNRKGMAHLLESYGKMIFLEEDIVTAPGFLQFMNDALAFYKKDETVVSITGYCPPIKIPKKYNEDVFLLQRFSAWGFGTWAKKFDPFGFDVHDHGVAAFLKEKKAVRQFCRNGEDMAYMLRLEAENKIDALDVNIMFYQFKHNKYSVYPVKSLTENIGHDGSGIHCGKTDKFNVELWGKTQFRFAEKLILNEDIIKANYKFRKLPLRNKMIELIKKFK